MKKKISIIVICVLLCAVLSSCTIFGMRVNTNFDEETEAAIDIITKTNYLEYDGKDSETKYYAIAGDIRKKEIEAFEPDEMTVFELGTSTWKINANYRYVSGPAIDSSEVDEIIYNLVTEFNKNFNHGTFFARVLFIGDEVLLYVNLNVNLSDPHELYYYNKETGEVYGVCQMDSEEITGIKIKNAELLKDRTGKRRVT